MRRPRAKRLWEGWAARYRVWQAARKDLAYPENELTPEPPEGEAPPVEKPPRRRA